MPHFFKIIHLVLGIIQFVYSYVVIYKDLTLDSVLLVLNLDCNLLSISKLTQEANRVTKFFPNHCVFQDLNSRKTIGNVEVCSGHYIFKVTNCIEKQPE